MLSLSSPQGKVPYRLAERRVHLDHVGYIHREGRDSQKRAQRKLKTPLSEKKPRRCSVGIDLETYKNVSS